MESHKGLRTNELCDTCVHKKRHSAPATCSKKASTYRCHCHICRITKYLQGYHQTFIGNHDHNRITDAWLVRLSESNSGCPLEDDTHLHLGSHHMPTACPYLVWIITAELIHAASMVIPRRETFVSLKGQRN